MRCGAIESLASAASGGAPPGTIELAEAKAALITAKAGRERAEALLKEVSVLHCTLGRVRVRVCLTVGCVCCTARWDAYAYACALRWDACAALHAGTRGGACTGCTGWVARAARWDACAARWDACAARWDASPSLSPCYPAPAALPAAPSPPPLHFRSHPAPAPLAATASHRARPPSRVCAVARSERGQGGAAERIGGQAGPGE